MISAKSNICWELLGSQDPPQFPRLPRQRIGLSRGTLTSVQIVATATGPCLCYAKWYPGQKPVYAS